jgi:ubiquinone/menaquinone biosynthesis C-methylase UbiE
MERAEVASLWEASAETWTRGVRAGYDIYRDALNTPTFLAMLPPIGGLHGLDIGCGEGANTRQLAGLGARMQGVDIAPTFVQRSQEVEAESPLGIVFQAGDGMALPFADASFDFATAFMCFMDMPDQGLALKEAHRVLRPGGFLQFSIQHPCFFGGYRKVLRNEDGKPRAVELAGYFEIGPIAQNWMFSTMPAEERATVAPFQTPRFHRTLSSWVDLFNEAGLTIERIVEPSASPELAAAEAEVADTRVVPQALMVRLRKA